MSLLTTNRINQPPKRQPKHRARWFTGLKHRRPKAYAGATANWSPAAEQAAIEPQLPDVELVKRSEDELIVHQLLNDIEAAFRAALDKVVAEGMKAIVADDATSYHRALVCSEPTGQYQVADLMALLAETALVA